ncbi:MAG: MFS transporter, partial [Pseudomonadota bacterium]
MLSSPSRDSLTLRINQRVFYGWVMLGVAGLAMFASGPGQSYTFGVFVAPIAMDLAMSQTAVSSAYATAT